MTETQTMSSEPRRRHSRSSRRRSHWSRRSKLMAIALGLCLIVIFFLSLYFGIQLYSLGKENQTLRINLAASQEELRLLRPEVKRLTEQLKDAVQGRIPSLRELRYDEVIPINKGHVKNILFNQLVKGNNTEFEYKLLFENTTSFVVWPQVAIYLFDDVGMQVGSAEIGLGGPDQDNVQGFESVGSNEIRSFSDTVPITLERTPAYFLVVTNESPLKELEEEEDFSYDAKTGTIRLPRSANERRRPPTE